MPLPKTGIAADEILAQLQSLQAQDVDWKSGRAFSLAYHAGADVLALATEALARFQSANALNVAAFPSLKRMQAEVVEMAGELLHGGPEAAGFMTSGGTESILLAVKAARTRGRERGIRAPEMVLPTSAHAAFEKGAAYFDVRSVRVPVGADYRADPAAMEAAITPNTVLLVASAPQYPQGVVDPVAEVAALAAARDLNCHVDACMGGITLPMLERLGHPLPPFDFRVPGVTSISVDLHKYGYTAKGASVILHRNKALRQQQTFTTDNWLGGLYGSSGVLGTKSGGPIAAAWAVMRYLGEDGYLRLTASARRATEALVAGLRATPGVRLLAEPDATLVAFTLDDADVFALGATLFRRGWMVDQQQPPPSLHCTVNAVHEPVIPAFLADLRAALDEVRTQGAIGKQQAYGTTS
ncbi:MAG: aspartate aminotransferase family protein [Deltaproteobacteria bacterium]|nr:aspartate aminotransferase family protein [Deltaproteobacteria bacterium]